MGKGREIIYVSLDEIKKPRDGDVIVDRWWVHKPGKGVAFVKMDRNHQVPQCNREYEIAEHIRKRVYPGHDLALIPVAFLGYVDHG